MSPREADGYTLIELLVVLAIMGLIAIVAIPVAGRTIESALLRTDVRALATQLRGLEAASVGRGKTIAIELRAGVATDSLGVPLELPHGSAVAFVDAKAPVHFYPDGTSDGGTFRVSRDGRSLDVNVEWLTGIVSAEAAP